MLKHFFSATQATPLLKAGASPRREAGIQVNFTTAANQFRRLISYLIIVSLLLADTAFCMRRTVLSQPYEVGQEERNKASFRRLSAEFPKKSIPLTDGKVRERSRSLDDLTSSMDVEKEKDSSSSYSSSYMSLSDGDIHDQGSRSPSDNSSNITPNGSPTHSSTIDVEQRSPSVSPQSDNIFPKLLIEPRPLTFIHPDEVIQVPLQVKEVVKEIVGNAEHIIESKKQLMLLSSLQNRLEDHVIARMADNVEYYLALSSLRQVQDEEREQQPQEEDQHQADLAKTSTQQETLEVKREEKPNEKRFIEDESSSSDEEPEQDEFVEALGKALNRAALKDNKTSSASSSAPEFTEKSRLLPPPHHQSNPVGITGSIQEPENPEENNDDFVMIGTGQSVSNYLNGQNLNIQKSGNCFGEWGTTIKNAWKNLRTPKAEKRPSTENHNDEADSLIPEEEESDLHPKGSSQNPNLLDQHPNGEQDPLLLIREDSASNSHKKQLAKVSSLFGFNDEDLEGGKAVVPIISFADLPREARQFLLHLKDRVIDGKLNKKQITSIGGGLIIGGAVSTPLMAVFLVGIVDLINRFNGEIVGNTPLDIVAPTIVGIVGPALGLDAASRGAAILIGLSANPIHSFSQQKNKEHVQALIWTKRGIYVGALLASALPLYYFYTATLLVMVPSNHTSKSYYVIFGSLAPFLIVDTVLQYGYQLSQSATRKINTYFYSKLGKEPLSSTEVKRQNYLADFKDLKKMIYVLEEDDLGDLYENVLLNALERTGKNPDINPEDLKINESLRVLQVLKKFHQAKAAQFDLEEEEDIKDVRTSRIGTGVAIAASLGRSMVFLYAIDQMLEGLGVPAPTKQILSAIFGFIIASFVQGIIEQQAVHSGSYDIGSSKKIPEATSHRPLRMGIKAWNYLIQGPFNTLPYILAGLDATSAWPLWTRILTLVPFGIADSFNNATTFNQSYLNVVDGVDSGISYCYSFMGYKRDKLIRMTRQMRRLFKELHADVLEAVDQQIREGHFDINPPLKRERKELDEV